MTSDTTDPTPPADPVFGPGTRVLVTGAASGLGAAITAAARARGAQVLATDRDGDDLAEHEGEGIARLDITSDDDWAAAVAWVERRWGALDVLVNNAGVAGGGRLDQAGLDEWQWLFDVNVFGMVRGVRAFTPMLKQHGGHVVDVASLAALVHPAGMASYNAAKAAVLAFTETVGHELASYGVTAHAVCPSYFRTNLMDSLRGRDTAIAQVMSRLVTDSPVSAEDVAEAVLAGVEAGEELILPDPAARAAYRMKVDDRSAYDGVMRHQAARLEQLSTVTTSEEQA
ncbi:SDR family NAD(P)-dependent oxidoreductase [Nocardioides marmoribigeumensis]|uniref:NAD(P)-dependent dehydrogenase (Short-subunit alcohol dehydrogenase family) n=1 Tax=Nocardioides marmoribigeumensis TaxID=433649 RepID=A0ABU2BVR6_9ACTN|nr:SDR family NAD(P)-dependent oxidoreductase [Nocardioides marmoribigeumensis]MDR7362727.1 NAD(P)-dependent dehydrogenase (short-subunit alcohol dehydrogenase family) [Nocardioides marmoribigeumensis]